MYLARVQRIPEGSQQEGEPYELANGAKGQSYRSPDGYLYERVVISGGTVKIYRSCEDPSAE